MYYQKHYILNMLVFKGFLVISLFLNKLPSTQTCNKHIITLTHATDIIFLLHFLIRRHNTSVWSMAALCSLAVRDSLSTSMCCLQSEFWLLRVSSLVCKARSSDSFFESSCFSWSICNRGKNRSLISFPIHRCICNLKDVNDHDNENSDTCEFWKKIKIQTLVLKTSRVSCNLMCPVLTMIALLLQKLKGKF